VTYIYIYIYIYACVLVHTEDGNESKQERVSEGEHARARETREGYIHPRHRTHTHAKTHVRTHTKCGSRGFRDS